MILCLYGMNDGKIGVKLLTSCGRVLQEGIVDLILFSYYPERVKEGVSVFVHVREVEIFVMTKEEVEYHVAEYYKDEVTKLFDNRKGLLVLKVKT